MPLLSWRRASGRPEAAVRAWARLGVLLLAEALLVVLVFVLVAYVVIPVAAPAVPPPAPTATAQAGR